MHYTNPDIESSYRENDLGRTLYETVLEKRPKKIVEFGILHGYSTVAMAMALDEIGAGQIVAYDLFEKYPFKHGSKDDVQVELDKYGIAKYVTLMEGDLDTWLKDPEPFDLLHIDVSNKGETIEYLHAALKDRVAEGAVVLFEGGSKERDEVEWMKNFNCKKMNDTTVPYTVINERFPSLSRML